MPTMPVDDDGGGPPGPESNSSQQNVAYASTSAQVHHNPETPAQSDAQMEHQQNAVPRVRQYPASAKGPYTVYIRERSAQMKPIKFAVYINNHYKSVELVKHNHNKIRVVLKELCDANRLVNDEVFHEYYVYIPADLVEIAGIIRHDELCDLNTTQELIEHGKGKHGNVRLDSVNIVEAQRLMRMNDDNVRVLTNSVKITFEGVVLPKYLDIGGLLVHVRPFHAKAMFCTTCQIFGHTSKFCNRNPKCARCLGPHTTSACPTPKDPICPYCNTQHTEGRNNCAFFREANEGFKLKQANRRKTRKQQALAAVHAPNVNIQNSFDSLDDLEDAPDRPQTTSSAPNPQARTSSTPSQIANPYERYLRQPKRQRPPSPHSPSMSMPQNPNKRPKEALNHSPSQQIKPSTERSWAQVARQAEAVPTNNWSPSVIKRKVMQAAEQQGLNPICLSILESVIGPLLEAILPLIPQIISSFCTNPQNG